MPTVTGRRSGSGGGFSIEWDIDLGDVLVSAIPRLLKNIEQEMQAMAKAMEQYAKQNHPWQNRTGAAERTFSAKPIGNFTILISHGVYYGIFLEYSNGGRYGIIRETLRIGEQEMLRGLQRAWQATW